MAKYTQIGSPIGESDAWWTDSLVTRVGPSAAARRIGVTRGTLAAIIAGLPIAASTAARVRLARQRAQRRAA